MKTTKKLYSTTYGKSKIHIFQGIKDTSGVEKELESHPLTRAVLLDKEIEINLLNAVCSCKDGSVVEDGSHTRLPVPRVGCRVQQRCEVRILLDGRHGSTYNP